MAATLLQQQQSRLLPRAIHRLLQKSTISSEPISTSSQPPRATIPPPPSDRSVVHTDLNRDFLARLWIVDREMSSSTERRRLQMQRLNRSRRESAGDHRSASQHPFARLLPSLPSASEDKSRAELGSVVDHSPPSPPPSPPIQSAAGFLKPATSSEARIAPLLAQSNLLITRDIEWANLVVGFEQENRYSILDVCSPQSPAGFIREKSNALVRQLLGQRRPFVAYVIDAMGNELFTIRRPFWWITSSIYAEIDGQEFGMVHRRWHLWRRIYDLYLGDKQFAVVENPGLWNWTFTLKDADDKVLAEIDRNWRGFGFEIFTDAGQYVIRFGSSNPTSVIGHAGVKIQDLEVARPLTLLERAVALALAVSLDNDYFSRHGGWGIPFIASEE